MRSIIESIITAFNAAENQKAVFYRIIIFFLILFVILIGGLVVSCAATVLKFIAPKNHIPPFNSVTIFVSSVVSLAVTMAASYLISYFIVLTLVLFGFNTTDHTFIMWANLIIYFPVTFYMFFVMGSFVASTATNWHSFHALSVAIFYVGIWYLIYQWVFYESYSYSYPKPPDWVIDLWYMGMLACLLLGSNAPFEEHRARLR